MTDGQVLDVSYVPLVQPQLAPAWIDHVLRYRGITLPRSAGDPSFRYIDLGCGLGLTLLCLAAAYPKARFTGVDANPEHMDLARDIANRTGLENIEFLTAKFGDPVVKSIPPAEYVVSDGVYSWIPEATRAELIAAFERLLLPGGAALISANLMAGWLAMLPAQRLISDMQAADPEIEPAALIDRSRKMIGQLKTDSRSATIRQGAETVETVLSDQPQGYIIHEFLPHGWQPAWTADLARTMAAVGLNYCGVANLKLLRDDHALTKAQRKILAGVKDPLVALTLRESLVPSQFARMVFHCPVDKSAKQAIPPRMDGWLALIVAPAKIEYECLTPAGKLTFDSPTARRIIERLAHGPAKLADIAANVDPPSEDIFLKIIDSLCASHQLMPVDPPQKSPAIERLNTVLTERNLSVNWHADANGTPVRKQVSVEENGKV